LKSNINKKKFVIFIVIIGVFTLSYFSKKIINKNRQQLIRNNISKEYKGIVTNKKSPNRKGAKTHFELLTNQNEKILISPIQSTLNQINIGDSIYKLKNENFIIVYDSVKSERMEYIYLSDKMKSEFENNYPYLIID